ncbi:hypothetical protein J8273_8512 [Carpediemonas membranifera]|uniref:Uncharacterized protein n=1 Tax=Carpediemonas membranifera TaxID=201153 RepID=A0A8J6APS0_9EUKA|nr:hypothetical protein J8273_8512 [Carpediemonas membranifera]|eukprot:KAG9389833.1 hypothetical protein J8273_8512 [Carpediemonas membranifera]
MKHDPELAALERMADTMVNMSAMALEQEVRGNETSSSLASTMLRNSAAVAHKPPNFTTFKATMPEKNIDKARAVADQLSRLVLHNRTGLQHYYVSEVDGVSSMSFSTAWSYTSTDCRCIGNGDVPESPPPSPPRRRKRKHLPPHMRVADAIERPSTGKTGRQFEGSVVGSPLTTPRGGPVPVATSLSRPSTAGTMQPSTARKIHTAPQAAALGRTALAALRAYLEGNDLADVMTIQRVGQVVVRPGPRSPPRRVPGGSTRLRPNTREGRPSTVQVMLDLPKVQHANPGAE